MSDTPIVDLRHWRAAHPVASSVPTDAERADAETPRGENPDAETPRGETSGAATVIPLPVASPFLEQHDPAVSGAPRSVFGPVVAFGLVPRAPQAPPAAVGGDVPVPAVHRQRQLRARHLADARGASRGPGR